MPNFWHYAMDTDLHQLAHSWFTVFLHRGSHLSLGPRPPGPPTYFGSPRNNLLGLGRFKHEKTRRYENINIFSHKKLGKRFAIYKHHNCTMKPLPSFLHVLLLSLPPYPTLPHPRFLHGFHLR